MFSHQSDAFILNYASMDDSNPIISLDDYSEYDWADDIDDSGVPKPTEPAHPRQHHRQYVTDGSGPNAEDISLSFHHPLDGIGVFPMVTNPLQRRRPLYVMLKRLMPFTVSASLWDSNQHYS